MSHQTDLFQNAFDCQDCNSKLGVNWALCIAILRIIVLNIYHSLNTSVHVTHTYTVHMYIYQLSVFWGKRRSFSSVIRLIWIGSDRTHRLTKKKIYRTEVKVSVTVTKQEVVIRALSWKREEAKAATLESTYRPRSCDSWWDVWGQGVDLHMSGSPLTETSGKCSLSKKADGRRFTLRAELLLSCCNTAAISTAPLRYHNFSPPVLERSLL